MNKASTQLDHDHADFGLCTIHRFALHVFRTAGVSEQGGSTVFTDVQELAAMGGLDTHASESSLWNAVAQAGIVNVDRWVVAAVLRQATDAVATADAGSIGPVTAAAGGQEHETADLAAATIKCAVVVKEAASLWEELREEAFLSVLGRSNRRSGQDTAPGAELSPGTAGPSTTPIASGEEQRPEILIATADASGGGDGTEQRTRRRYDTLRANPRSFDIALTRALALAGRGGAGRRFAAATQADAGTGHVSLLGSPTRIEDILLHNFVIAGFARGSHLDVSDVVNAVSVRRQRALSAAAAVEAAAGSASRGAAEEDDVNVAGSSNYQGRPEGELSEGTRRRVLPAEETTGEEVGATLSENERGAAGAEWVDGEDASVEADLKTGVLAGIPAELRGLFRAAELVRVERKRQQSEREKVGGWKTACLPCQSTWNVLSVVDTLASVATANAKKKHHHDLSSKTQHNYCRLYLPQARQDGSSDNDELQAAERAVVRLLDSNRTLESAPFSDGKTALHHAAARGDDFLVRLLLDRGCPPFLKVGIVCESHENTIAIIFEKTAACTRVPCL